MCQLKRRNHHKFIVLKVHKKNVFISFICHYSFKETEFKTKVKYY